MTKIKCPFKCDHKRNGICNRDEIEMTPVNVYGGYEPVCGNQMSRDLRNSLD